MIQECCQKDENLELTSKEGPKTVRTCKVCKRRHITVEVDAAQVGVKLK